MIALTGILIGDHVVEGTGVPSPSPGSASVNKRKFSSGLALLRRDAKLLTLGWTLSFFPWHLRAPAVQAGVEGPACWHALGRTLLLASPGPLCLRYERWTHGAVSQLPVAPHLPQPPQKLRPLLSVF